MHAPQEHGIVKSLQKLATPTASTESTGMLNCVEKSNINPALDSPMIPTIRRERDRPPSHCSKGTKRYPATKQPTPPNNNGTHASIARSISVTDVNCSFK